MRNYLIIACTTIIALTTACNTTPQWEISGNISGIDNNTLRVEASDNGYWYVLDTIATESNGDFSYSHNASGYPDIYRLTLNDRHIYFPIDSIESVTIKATATNFDTDYTLAGTIEAETLMAFDRRVRQAINEKGVDAISSDSLLKRELGEMIITKPSGVVAYYIVNKQFNGKPIFNPALSYDNRLIGAVANAYNELRPADPRTAYLKWLFLSNRQSNTTVNDTIVVNEIPLFEINLTDNTGKAHSLTQEANGNKVVVLNFTIYTAQGSPAFNIALADIYKKFQNSGVEIYQVALDNDEFQWKQTAKNLPWITVYNPPSTGARILLNYNVHDLPTSFIIANGELAERVDDISLLEKAIKKYL